MANKTYLRNNLRLAICSVGELFGGVERQILDLCTFLGRNGLGDPLVVLFHDMELARQLRERDIHPVIISGRNRYDLNMLSRLKSIMIKNNINAVHAHGYKATIACGLIKNQVGFRLVKTEHGKRESTITRPFQWLKALANFNFELFVTKRKVDFVAYVTRDIQEYFSKFHEKLPHGTIYNGIDPLNGEEYQRPEDLPGGKFNIGIVGRLTPVKGIPFALKALKGLSIDRPINLIVIGTGVMLDELKELTLELDLGHRVKFLGFRANIFVYICHLDALMIPSYHEGLPYSLLETMSLAKPIIASRVGGLQEILRDGETGYLVNVGDVGGLSRAIRRLEQSWEIRKEMGQSSRVEQMNNFTLDLMGNKYLQLYLGENDLGVGT